MHSICTGYCAKASLFLCLRDLGNCSLATIPSYTEGKETQFVTSEYAGSILSVKTLWSLVFHTDWGGLVCRITLSSAHLSLFFPFMNSFLFGSLGKWKHFVNSFLFIGNVEEAKDRHALLGSYKQTCFHNEGDIWDHFGSSKFTEVSSCLLLAPISGILINYFAKISAFLF